MKKFGLIILFVAFVLSGCMPAYYIDHSIAKYEPRHLKAWGSLETQRNG